MCIRDRILFRATGNVILVDTDGSQYNFIKQTDGTYTGEPFLGYKLIKNGTSYNLTKVQEHKVYTYNTILDTGRAQLTQIADQNNNVITIAYNAAGYISN